MKTLKRCRNNIEADNVVLIDVDTYNFNNVIVIDVPETHTKKRGGSKGLTNDKNRPLRTYIYIDDDESPDTHHAGAHNRDRNFDNGASSSRRYGQDTHFSQENNISPVKLSKGKRTYSGRGFNTLSDSDSSDDDSPDCEFMEDYSGKLKEEWERASLKRKANLDNNQHEDIIPHAESSSPDCDANGNVDVGCSKPDLQTPSTSSQEENEKDDLLDDPTIDEVPVESSIIDLREKLKETDEYKQALEEEWSARQIALKIQAEEAQQLKRMQKRKKAESLRLLDMERRQKQRVEEIRETQKKDEENMNLKEVYRTEVRQKLKKLEITCLDMTSLLRSLGIQVGDSPSPLPHEVRAAYKRALLSFHPDRASTSDMRQQVEAEEKFKLISRMKEKLLG